MQTWNNIQQQNNWQQTQSGDLTINAQEEDLKRKAKERVVASAAWKAWKVFEWDLDTQ